MRQSVTGRIHFALQHAAPCTDGTTRSPCWKPGPIADTIGTSLSDNRHDEVSSDGRSKQRYGNLGGLVLGIREQECEWEVEDADAVAVALPARYRFTYRTLANDLSTPG